ncbi:MAG: hypothetical protein MI725_13920 [Pirellulales bacterium]|nr:hypothetical protein [Pirellulales bacterium]
MWLPGPLYEALPYVYIFGGVLFIAGTLYLGLDASGATLYISCGLASIVSGAAVFLRRQMARKRMQDAADAAKPTADAPESA